MKSSTNNINMPCCFLGSSHRVKINFIGYLTVQAKDVQWVGRHMVRHRHGTCPFNTARHEHISVRHEARHGTHVGRAGP